MCDLIENINKHLNDTGIKKVRVAEKTGISKSTLSAILSKKRRMTADEFILICDALDVDPNYFSNTCES